MRRARSLTRPISSSSVGGPLSARVGCTWRRGADQQGGASPAVPAGYIRFRDQLAEIGGALTFRVPALTEDAPIRLQIRSGCLGDAAMSGRHATGGVVASSNPQLCGNRSGWWGFAGVTNADGALRERAGSGLEAECEALPPAAASGEKLLPSTVRATSAHALRTAWVLHALGPTSFHARESEAALRRTYAACFDLADSLGLGSLALPALACGVAGFPATAGARAAFDAVERRAAAAAGAAGGTLARVEFVLLDRRVYCEFADEAWSRWQR